MAVDVEGCKELAQPVVSPHPPRSIRATHPEARCRYHPVASEAAPIRLVTAGTAPITNHTLKPDGRRLPRAATADRGQRSQPRYLRAILSVADPRRKRITACRFASHGPTAGTGHGFTRTTTSARRVTRATPGAPRSTSLASGVAVRDVARDVTRARVSGTREGGLQKSAQGVEFTASPCRAHIPFEKNRVGGFFQTAWGLP
jgi:hypothetical protein